MEKAFADEIAFFQDTKNQYRYNLTKDPVLTTSALLPVATHWGAAFRPSAAETAAGMGLEIGLESADFPNTTPPAREPIRSAIDRCLGAAATGDYSACKISPEVDSAKNTASYLLDEYSESGLIVATSVAMPEADVSRGYPGSSPRAKQQACASRTRSESRSSRLRSPRSPRREGSGSPQTPNANIRSTRTTTARARTSAARTRAGGSGKRSCPSFLSTARARSQPSRRSELSPGPSPSRGQGSHSGWRGGRRTPL